MRPVSGSGSMIAICQARRTWCCPAIVRPSSSTGASGTAMKVAASRPCPERDRSFGRPSLPRTRSGMLPRHRLCVPQGGTFSRSGSARRGTNLRWIDCSGRSLPGSPVKLRQNPSSDPGRTSGLSVGENRRQSSCFIPGACSLANGIADGRQRLQDRTTRTGRRQDAHGWLTGNAGTPESLGHRAAYGIVTGARKTCLAAMRWTRWSAEGGGPPVRSRSACPAGRLPETSPDGDRMTLASRR